MNHRTSRRAPKKIIKTKNNKSIIVAKNDNDDDDDYDNVSSQRRHHEHHEQEEYDDDDNSDINNKKKFKQQLSQQDYLFLSSSSKKIPFLVFGRRITSSFSTRRSIVLCYLLYFVGCIITIFLVFILIKPPILDFSTSTTTTRSSRSINGNITMIPDANKKIQQNQQQQRSSILKKKKKRIIKIACVGDSLTRGDIGPNITNGIDDYPTQLKELLILKSTTTTTSSRLRRSVGVDNVDNGDDGDDSKNIEFVIGNFGKNGATALRNVRPSYDHTKEFRLAIEFQPDIVLIGLGTNDVKFLSSPELRMKHRHVVVSSFLWLIEQFHLISTRINNNKRIKSKQQQHQPPPPKIFLARRPPYVVKSFQKIRQKDIEIFLHPLLDDVVSNATTLLSGTVDLDRITRNNNNNNVHQNEEIYINDGLHLNHKGYHLVAKAWLNELIRSGVLMVS